MRKRIVVLSIFWLCCNCLAAIDQLPAYSGNRNQHHSILKSFEHYIFFASITVITTVIAVMFNKK